MQHWGRYHEYRPQPFVEVSMKTIELTQGYVALVDDEDFERAVQYRWFASVRKNTVYAQRSTPRVGGKQGVQSLHRFILWLPGGQKPEVDHEDRNGLNCQRHNLRSATGQQNSYNRKAKQKYKGVSWCKSHEKWRSRIHINNKEVHLGYFDTQELAVTAYDIAALKYYKDFALTNEKLAQQESAQHE